MTFEDFMKKRVDRVVGRISGIGLGADDFCDAPWRDLYDDLGEDVTDEDIIECLSEWDDIFAQMAQLQND